MLRKVHTRQFRTPLRPRRVGPTLETIHDDHRPRRWPLKELRSLVKYGRAMRVDSGVAIVRVYAVKDDPLFHRRRKFRPCTHARNHPNLQNE